MSPWIKLPVAGLTRVSTGGFADAKSSSFVPHFGHRVAPRGRGVSHNMQRACFASVRV
jgi:hypothetical protein